MPIDRRFILGSYGKVTLLPPAYLDPTTGQEVPEDTRRALDYYLYPFYVCDVTVTAEDGHVMPRPRSHVESWLAYARQVYGYWTFNVGKADESLRYIVVSRWFHAIHTYILRGFRASVPAVLRVVPPPFAFDLCTLTALLPQAGYTGAELPLAEAGAFFVNRKAGVALIRLLLQHAAEHCDPSFARFALYVAKSLGIVLGDRVTPATSWMGPTGVVDGISPLDSDEAITVRWPGGYSSGWGRPDRLDTTLCPVEPYDGEGWRHTLPLVRIFTHRGYLVILPPVISSPDLLREPSRDGTFECFALRLTTMTLAVTPGAALLLRQLARPDRGDRPITLDWPEANGGQLQWRSTGPLASMGVAIFSPDEARVVLHGTDVLEGLFSVIGVHDGMVPAGVEQAIRDGLPPLDEAPNYELLALARVNDSLSSS